MEPREDIRALHADGASIDEIEACTGTPQHRVHELLLAAGITEERLAERQAQVDWLDAYAEHVLELRRRGAAARAIALRSGIPVPVLLRWSARRGLRVHGRKGPDRVPTEVLVAAVAELGARLGRTPTCGDYDRFAAERGLPGKQTVLIRLGSWKAALRAAGFAPTGLGRPHYERRWTAEACWQALGQVVGRLGEVPTFAAYEELARAHEDLPSGATVRIRLGGWSAVRERLA